YACHDRGAVDQGEAFPDFHLYGLKSFGFKYLRSLADFTLVKYFTFPDEGEGQVGQLYEVTAGAYSSVLKDQGEDVTVQELPHQGHDGGVYARIAETKCIQAGQHGCPDEFRGQGISRPRGMTPDQVVLQLGAVCIRNAVLRHGTKAC